MPLLGYVVCSVVLRYLQRRNIVCLCRNWRRRRWQSRRGWTRSRLTTGSSTNGSGTGSRRRHRCWRRRTTGCSPTAAARRAAARLIMPLSEQTGSTSPGEARVLVARDLVCRMHEDCGLLSAGDNVYVPGSHNVTVVHAFG
jgi:hypothetical protein